MSILESDPGAGIGREFMIPERAEPVLPLGYVGRVCLVSVSQDGQLGWIEKLDPRRAGDDFPRALVNLSDLREIKIKKESKASATDVSVSKGPSLFDDPSPRRPQVVAQMTPEAVREMHLTLNLFD